MMRPWLSLLAAVCGLALPAAANVLTYHGAAHRAGAYRVPGLTLAAAGNVRRDTGFDGTVMGDVRAQPLYWRPAGVKRGLVIVATEENSVYALDDATGAVVWRTELAPPMPLDELPCGNIDPIGITGTPAIDPATATLYLNAQTKTASGARHMVYALSLTDGSVKTGWPLDVQAALATKGEDFDSAYHGERSAVLLFGGKLYVNYAGNAGDCGTYRGTVIELATSPPALTAAWRTRGLRGGIWAQGGLAGDGTALYLTTGNTKGTEGAWADGEAVIRLRAGLARSTRKRDYFTPANWQDLDSHDKDLGGTEALPLDIPVANARPARRLIAFGKDGNAYLIDRGNLGGIGGQVATLGVSTLPIRTAPAVYTSANSTMVAFASAAGGDCPDRNITMLDVAPNAMSVAWCALFDGAGAPIVTTTDGASDAIVWVTGAEGDGLLHGFDALSGAPVFSDPGPAMIGLHHFSTIIATQKRFYIAGRDKVYAYIVTP